jgi:Flp pilus assembly protein TadG
MECVVKPWTWRQRMGKSGEGETNRSARAEKREGQSLVEFGLAMPLLLLLCLATLDLGRVFFDYIQLRQAVREGAGYASRNPSDSTGITQAVTDAGIASGVAITSYCTGVCTKEGGVGWMTVSATQTFTPITTGFLSDLIGIGPITLSASSTMRAMT